MDDLTQPNPLLRGLAQAMAVHASLPDASSLAIKMPPIASMPSTGALDYPPAIPVAPQLAPVGSLGMNTLGMPGGLHAPGMRSAADAQFDASTSAPSLGAVGGMGMDGSALLASHLMPGIAMPSVSKFPAVTTPGLGSMSSPQTLQDQAELARLTNSGSGLHQLTHPVDENGDPTGAHVGWGAKLGAGALKALEVAGSLYGPTRALEMAIPGTELHHEIDVDRQRGNVQADQSQDAAFAQLAQTQAQTDAVQARMAREQRPSYQVLQTDNGPMALQDGTTQATNFTGPDGQALQAPEKPQTKQYTYQQTDHGLIKIDPDGNASQVTLDGKPLAKPASDRPDTPEQQYIDDYLKRNPGSSIGDAIHAYGAASQRPLQARMRAGGGDASAASFPSANASGGPDAVLGSLPAGMAAQVKAIGEGRMPPPNSRSKQGMALMNVVAQAYPGYDASQYGTYAKMRGEFTSGQTGKSINSFNTALNHLDSLEANLPHNRGLPLWNKMANSALDASGSSANTAFEAAATAVSDELAKAYKGGAVTDAEHQNYQKLLDRDASPAQQKANLAELRTLLQGKLDAYDQQWKAGMPSGVVRPMATLNPKASLTPAGSQGGQSSQLPSSVAAMLQEGKVHTFGNGQQWTLRGGQPVKVN